MKNHYAYSLLLTTVFSLFVVEDLPIEVLSYIMLLAVGRHDTMTYRAINLTSKQFQYVASTLPLPTHLPKIYLGPYLVNDLKILPGPNTINMVAYRDVLEVAGRGSGVAINLPTLVDEDVILDPDTTVLLLRHKGLGWFYLLDVKQNPKSLMKYCK